MVEGYNDANWIMDSDDVESTIDLSLCLVILLYVIVLSICIYYLHYFSNYCISMMSMLLWCNQVG